MASTDMTEMAASQPSALERLRFFLRPRTVPLRVALIAVLCAAASLLAISPLSAQRYTYRQYGPSDGLTNLGVNCLIEDHIGYLWVGTDNGLFRYDGETFKPFGHAEGLPNVEIRSLAESPQGVLWVATQDGVARSTGDHFEPVNPGISGVFLGLAFDAAGHLYLEHTTGILRGTIDNTGNYKFAMVAPGAVGGLYVHDTDVWFRRDGDLYHLNGDTAESIGASAGLPKSNWGSVTLDSIGNLWVRSATFLYELPHGQSRFVDRSEGIPPAIVNRLFADTHGGVYVSSNSGVVLLSGQKRVYLDPQHGLPSDVSAPILVDRNETLWIGMRGGGLVRRLGQGEWLSWRKEDGLLNDSVWSVLHDRSDRLWVGTSGGLSIFDADGKLAHSWTTKNGLPGENVFALMQAPNGDVFAVSGPAGLTRFSAEGKLLRTYSPPGGWGSEQLNTLTLDRERRMWIAASGSLFRSREAYDANADLQFEKIDVPGMPPGVYYHSIECDDAGKIWISTSSGLLRFDGTQWKAFTAKDGLASGDVSGMIVGHNEVWVAYRDALGIARVRFQGDRAEVTPVTQRDGLASDLVYALIFDKQGRLWASTDNGVSVLEPFGGGQSEHGVGHWRHYGTEDGLIWDDGDDLAIATDREGDVWIGTSRGLSRYSSPPYAISDTASGVVLTEIQGVSREFDSHETPVLSQSQNSLGIRFSGLNFSSERSTRYRYRLLGRSNVWKETQEHSVHFEGLPGGKYVFEVLAAGPNGLWSSTPARFAFSVRPPWWLTWWFIVGSVIVFLILSRAIWRFRVRALVAQKNLLEQQVIERTAELRESHRQLEEIAYFDSLTGLPNRRMFTEQFRNRLALARRQKDQFALLLIDLDNFKQVNDSFGHDAGDTALVQAATNLQNAVRESDCMARQGGDEFAILLIRPVDPAGIQVVCERVIASFAAGVKYNDTVLNVTCSIGAAVFPADGDTQDEIFKSADIALYRAKHAGGGTFRRYAPGD